MKKWQKIVFGELSWKRVLRSIASIYIILLIIAVSLGDYFIFTPPTASYSENDTDIELIPATTPKGKDIATFYLPAKENMPTLLWSHGNAEDLGYIRPLLKQFHTLGYGILAYDYPGYGASEGESNDKACYEAIERCYQHLKNKYSLTDSNIIAVGQSVGSGPACYIAEKENLKGLILITPFTSIYRVAFKYPIFPRDRFPNIKRIKNIDEPLLIIHGDQDDIIPHSHSEALVKFHSGNSTFHILPGRGHNDIAGRTPEKLDSYLKLFTDFTADLD